MHGTASCRLCGLHKESLGHVMGGCPNQNDLINDHPDEILKDFLAKLKSFISDWQLALEPRPAADVVHHKPGFYSSE